MYSVPLPEITSWNKYETVDVFIYLKILLSFLKKDTYFKALHNFIKAWAEALLQQNFFFLIIGCRSNLSHCVMLLRVYYWNDIKKAIVL